LLLKQLVIGEEAKKEEAVEAKVEERKMLLKK
jgi:hypothetical protein